MNNMDQHGLHVAQIVSYFENLRLSDLSRLDQFYSAQAWFKDPFSEVTGPAAIRAIFERRGIIEPK